MTLRALLSHLLSNVLHVSLLSLLTVCLSVHSTGAMLAWLLFSSVTSVVWNTQQLFAEFLNVSIWLKAFISRGYNLPHGLAGWYSTVEVPW